MSRLIRLVSLTMLVLAITAGTAMALGSMNVTTATIDYKMTAGGTVTRLGTVLKNTDAVSISYRPASEIPAGGYTVLTLTGAKFKSGETVYLSSAGSSNVATGTVGASNSATVTCVIGTGQTLSSTQEYFIVSTTGGATASQALPSLVFDQGMASGGSVTMAIRSYNETGNEYVLSSISATDIIKSMVLTTQTMTITGTEDTATTSSVLNRTVDVNKARQKFVTDQTTSTFMVKYTNTAQIKPDTTSANFTYTMTVAGDLTGLSYIKLGSNTAQTVTATNISAGTVAVTGNGASDPLTNTGDVKNVVFTADGATTLGARTFTISFVITKIAEGTTATYTPVQTSLAHAWLINGYQGLIPYSIANDNYTTICMFNNANSTSADIYADVKTSESGAITNLTGLVLGSVSANSTKRVDLNTKIIPYNWTSGAEVADTTNTRTLTALTAGDRYSTTFTVTGVNSGVTATCVQVDYPNPQKRVVPVLTPADTTSYWKQ